MAYVNDRRTGGDIWMIKDEQTLFSHVWARLDSRSDLTDEERTTLDTFGDRWFEGDNFKPKSAAYIQFLEMCDKYSIKLIRTQRKWRSRPEGLVRYTTPYHIDGQEEGSQWPKDRTKKMGDKNSPGSSCRASSA